MPVLLDMRDGVAIVTLNRPEAMNAIDPDMRAELRQVWRRVSEDDTVRCAVLTGAGSTAFCTGSDLKKTMPPAESFAQLAFTGTGQEPMTAGMDMDTPIVCAINGHAFGGGLELALACDIRLASTNAQFALPEVRLGTLPAAGGTQRLPRLVSPSDAMMMLLTGDRFGAVEALRMGLVSEVLPPAELMESALAIARRIAQNAPLSVRAIKRLVRTGLEMPLDKALQTEYHVFGLLRDTEDRIEGRRAFQEKRTPVYRGR
ncbi:enoyl-CoA hydratase-related protein [Hydrogenophaga sp. 2FB]|uniref:enoyl-CoA hydratase/isomerase family protein n=1 Tax=Hydrogenophaga sp. 2FB TaxID=2502187 RepID=UPI0010F9C4AE|nr:enoyl-CoA hydratase-related protein [Hydrogenophaga sp. 2FB]